jgi:hypothetical protein
MRRICWLSICLAVNFAMAVDVHALAMGQRNPGSEHYRLKWFHATGGSEHMSSAAYRLWTVVSPPASGCMASAGHRMSPAPMPPWSTGATGIAAVAGNGEVTVVWSDPPAGCSELEIWRGLWIDGNDPADGSAYPEYDDLPNDVVPARPASHAAAHADPRWVLAGVVAPGDEAYTDDMDGAGLSRGVYHYEVFARNTVGLPGPPPPAGARATSYVLGDLDGDGFVGLGNDVSSLGAHYGTSDGDADYDSECDFGPTDDYSGAGIPLTDDEIDFADLMIVALNYGPPQPRIARAAPAASLLWTMVGEREWALILSEPCPGLKGVNLRADLQSGAVAAVGEGELVLAQASPCFLRNIDSRGLDVGLAILGSGVGFEGAGELFRVVLSGPEVPGEIDISLCDTSNRHVAYSLAVGTDAPALPARCLAHPNHPNPFNPGTSIRFELPEPRHVMLEIFGLDGRRVTTLLDRELPAGYHTAVWHGRDSDGRSVASGVYFYRFRAGPYTRTDKMMLVR